MKVNGVKGNLGEDVTITESKGKVTVTSNVRFPKRYLKYLTKKYFKKADVLFEYLRLISSDKHTYKVVYLDVNEDDQEEEN